MERFILIETSTDACSVALTENSKVIASRYIQEYKAHAKMLIPLVQEVLLEASLSISDCSAVAVSEGPGSYTGLRVGVSSAKGLCYGAGLQLMGISTLEILAHMGKEYVTSTKSAIIPMIDARRMEVYSSVYSYDSLASNECDSLNMISDVEAKVLDEMSYDSLFNEFDQLIFIGDGAKKFSDILTPEKLVKSTFVDVRPDAKYMATSALHKWNKKEFKDIAYFEPFYLKDFVAGVSKKFI